MAEVELQCAVYGEATVFPVKVALDAPVSALQEVIANKYRVVSNRVQVYAATLTLYLARKTGETEWVKHTHAFKDFLRGGVSTEYAEMLSSWTLNDSELFGSTFAPRRREIHVLVQLPPTEPAPGMRRTADQLAADGSILELSQRPFKMIAVEELRWIQSSTSCPQLQFQESSTAVIPWAYLEHTGLKDLMRDQDLVIYRRRALREQWNEIQRDAIDAEAILWIVGAPGAGKSCAAYAFACGHVDRAQWNVLWIHIDSRRTVHCVKFEGDSKATCAVRVGLTPKETVELLLSSFTSNQKLIVFFDGYKMDTTCAIILDVLDGWQFLDPSRHRLVVVTSMAAIRYNLNHHSRLEASPTKPSRQNGRVALFEQMMFSLSSWTLEEYYAAVQQDDFFLSVMPVFDVEKVPAIEGRKKLVKDKFFVAGGCARAMFAQTIAEAERNLRVAVAAVPNAKDYATSAVGGNSTGAVNRLIALHDVAEVGEARFQSSIVSGYATRELGRKLGPDGVLEFAKCFTVNPAMDGHLFEAWVVASLERVDGLKYRLHTSREERNWEQHEVLSFDPTRDVLVDMGRYFVPIKWNQAGYDAVYIEFDEALAGLRYIFLQVTRAKTHSFVPEPFVDVLHMLGDENKKNVGAVELWFVVPNAILDQFSTGDANLKAFQKNVVDVALLENAVATRIAVVGVDYPYV